MNNTSERPLNIVFAGTPEFAAKHLMHLIKSSHNIIGVYSQPDRPAGRGKKLSASAVKQLALENSIPVYQPISLKHPEAQKEFESLHCDVLVVVAYGLILPKTVLDTPKHGCLNVHGSILPKWRGAAPIQRAIEAGDTVSGVTIMQMDVGLDTGDMLLKVECPIFANDTTLDLHDRLCDIGPPALLHTLEQIQHQSLSPESQNDSLSTYAKKIEKSEAIINWQESAEKIDRQIRAFNPFPISYGTINGERIRIHSATLESSGQNECPGKIHIDDATNSGTTSATTNPTIKVDCGQGQLSLEKIQLPGKKALAVKDFLNGSLGLFSAGQFDLKAD